MHALLRIGLGALLLSGVACRDILDVHEREPRDGSDDSAPHGGAGGTSLSPDALTSGAGGAGGNAGSGDGGASEVKEAGPVTAAATLPCLAPLFDAAAKRALIPVTVTTAAENNRYSSFATGELSYDAATDRLVSNVALNQLFSDRTKAWPPPPSCSAGPACAGKVQPFYAEASDQYKIQVERNGIVSLQNITWGGGATIVNVCAGKFLYQAGPGMFAVFSFGVPILR